MSKIDAVLMNFVARLQRLRLEDGQTLAEYSLIVTVVAVGVVTLALILFRTALAGAFDSATACFSGTC